jgi:serine/threonine protein phosphatase 1
MLTKEFTARFRARLQRFAPNAHGRDWAVGDIHGCFTGLQRGLDRIGFDATVDRLFSVGDLVDRGPESPDVAHWLTKPWFHAVCGNHDLMTWRSALGNPYPGVDHAAHGGAWLNDLLPGARHELARHLLALPLVIEVETPAGIIGIIHADCPFDDWRDMQSLDFATLADTDPVVNNCLWSIERYARKYVKPVGHVRALVHGHLTLSAHRVLGNVHFIDTGGWQPKGRFTFLNLHTLKPVT